jgi:hypothetical protein
MDRARGDFLTGASFAVDQRRGVAVGEPLDQRDGGLKHLRLTDQAERIARRRRDRLERRLQKRWNGTL